MINKHKGTKSIEITLIAPCGMNCRLCRAYARDKLACPGCRGDDSQKMISCIACRIKNCDMIAKGRIKYCFSCENYPCDRLKHLDKRYRTKYGMSMIENLENIKKNGIRKFIRTEVKRWSCPQCGEILSVHKSQCLNCQYTWH
jgi:hypothetical protein